MNAQEFTPAAGRFAPTGFYDRGVSLLTREAVWRSELLQLLGPANGETILDVGCGTGSLALLIKRAAPGAHVVGLDPDPQALSIARRKANAAGLRIEWRQGFAREAADGGAFDKVVSSLVFHQVQVEEKKAGMAAMFAAANAGGTICIADYARQGAWPMRQLFRVIQVLDGRANTEPNANGFLESELSMLCGRVVVARSAINTPTGTISIFLEKK
jgi:ubiquinone/menaquinone biosynthesis C-methylase UbiE